MKRLVILIAISGLTAFLHGRAKNDTPDDGGPTVIKYLVAESGTNIVEKEIVQQFNDMQSEIVVEIVSGSASASDNYSLILQTFEAQKDTIDIIPVDTIWPGDLADHLVDLKEYGAQEIADNMFAGLIENNTLEGRLLALPAFNTAGLLLYRSDLLKKYGYKAPPTTWDELESMASKIQEGERKTNPDFWGYLWQGASYEGLVCNLLEWTYSNGDDVWISKNRQITINNPSTAAAITRARNWIGRISPPGVLAFKEEESRAVFHAGNAAFHRNWFYAYGLANDSSSPLKGKVNFSFVPAGDAGHGAATTGAWSRGISKYSKHPQEAYKVLSYLVSTETTISKLKKTSEFPPYPAVYKDPQVLMEHPVLKLLEPVFENSVARPATITAPNYNNVSTVIARSVHEMLSTQIDIPNALEELALELEDITGFPSAG